jgi:hypothetical protein
MSSRTASERTAMHYHPQLSYLGVITKPEHSEYGFQIINDDKTVRLLILTIANSVFLTKQLLVQEAPDLCYQKVLADLKSNIPTLIEENIVISEADLTQYRASHPNISPKRKSFRTPPK